MEHRTPPSQPVPGSPPGGMPLHFAPEMPMPVSPLYSFPNPVATTPGRQVAQKTLDEAVGAPGWAQRQRENVRLRDREIMRQRQEEAKRVLAAVEAKEAGRALHAAQAKEEEEKRARKAADEKEEMLMLKMQQLGQVVVEYDLPVFLEQLRGVERLRDGGFPPRELEVIRDRTRREWDRIKQEQLEFGAAVGNEEGSIDDLEASRRAAVTEIDEAMARGDWIRAIAATGRLYEAWNSIVD